jgi:predicted nucleic acid-binding protein
MTAVCDMGPLHYLVLIGCDHILPRIFDRVVTAGVVIQQEMADPHTPEPVRRWAANPPQWLEVLEPKQVEDIPSLGRQGVRGDGDRAIISLARELGAGVLVMDDIKARREAKKCGIESRWMLEVLDEAAERGFIDDLSERLGHLAGRTSFYVGEKARAVIDHMKQRDKDRKLAKEQQKPEQSAGE